MSKQLQHLYLGKVKCSGVDLSKYLNDFSQFPPIIH